MTKNPAAVNMAAPTTKGTETRWNWGVPGELNKTSAPTMKEANPAAVSAPCVGALISMKKSTKEVTKNTIPNQFTGSTPMP